MKILSGLAAVLLVSGWTWAQTGNAKEAEIVRLSQQRFQAFFDGDRATYGRMVAKDAIFAYSNGRTLDYAQAMKELTPLAKPGSYKFHYEDVEFRDFGETVLLMYRLVFRGPEGEYQGVTTDLFERRNGGWQLVALHGTTIPYPNRLRAAVDPRLLDEYVGRYEGASGAYYDISREGNQLMGQRNGFARVPWLAESNEVFYVPSDPTASRVFLRDSRGKVSKIIRVDVDGDTVWQRQSSLR